MCCLSTACLPMYPWPRPCWPPGGFRRRQLVMCRGVAAGARSRAWPGRTTAWPSTIHQTLFSFSPGAARLRDRRHARRWSWACPRWCSTPRARRWTHRRRSAGCRPGRRPSWRRTGTRLALENGAYDHHETLGVVTHRGPVACARRYDLDLPSTPARGHRWHRPPGSVRGDARATGERPTSDLRPLRLLAPPLVDIVQAHHQLPGYAGSTGAVRGAPRADGYRGSVTVNLFMAPAFWSPREAVRRLGKLVAFVYGGRGGGARSEM